MTLRVAHLWVLAWELARAASLRSSQVPVSELCSSELDESVQHGCELAAHNATPLYAKYSQGPEWEASLGEGWTEGPKARRHVACMQETMTPARTKGSVFGSILC